MGLVPESYGKTYGKPVLEPVFAVFFRHGASDPRKMGVQGQINWGIRGFTSGQHRMITVKIVDCTAGKLEIG